MTIDHTGDPMLPHGSNRCKCEKCGEYFSTVGNFDRHQLIDKEGGVTCRDPATLGMIRGKSGHWQQPGDPERTFPVQENAATR